MGGYFNDFDDIMSGKNRGNDGILKVEKVRQDFGISQENTWVRVLGGF